MSEFDLIEKYFKPLTMGHAESSALQDDAAILKIPPDYELVVTSDTLNAGTHFFVNEEPVFIAHKALRVNLSDLAAMGAKPHAYQLCIAFPGAPSEAWLSDFSAALLADQKEFGIVCSGGDTTSIEGPLSITITAFGLVPEGKAVRRSGAKNGDFITLTGPVGNAWIGLQILQKKLHAKNPASFINAYKKPEPRTALAQILQDYAHAAIDISDGLVADLGHICKASGLGAEINLTNINFSPAALELADPKFLLTGGDDYELLLAVPPAQNDNLVSALTAQGLKPQIIGRMTAAHAGVQIRDKNGQFLTFGSSGWDHFGR
ncbi:MAG: thiamine-phosphate kinase [Alphaproteobacteria bacterium]